MRLAVVNTGGTISCVGEPLAPMSATDFKAASQRIIDPIVARKYPELELVYITDLLFSDPGAGTLDSTNVQPTDWCFLAARILADYEDFDGWIVLHGTDSMAYTASALPFLLSSFDSQGLGTAVLNKPVILTGSQVPLFADDQTLRFSTDAFQNLCTAIDFARTGIPEVAVAFDGKLFRGTRVIKTSADVDDAFSSPNFPPLGSAGLQLTLSSQSLLPGPSSESSSLDDAATLRRARRRLAYIASRIGAIAVVPFTAFPARFDGESAVLAQLLRAIVATGIDGLVLESYGEGNFPSGSLSPQSPGEIESVLARAVADGVVVVNCTQVISGTVGESSYAAGAWLPKIGALSPGDMTPIAAFAKTTVLLAERGWAGNNWGPTTVNDLIRQSLMGEMRQTDKLQVGANQELLPGQALRALDGSARLLNDPLRGPCLMDAHGTLLWSCDVGGHVAPVLVLRADGVSLVSRSGRSLWEAPAPAAYSLSLSGSHADGTLELSVRDRQGSVLTTIYVSRD